MHCISRFIFKTILGCRMEHTTRDDSTTKHWSNKTFPFYFNFCLMPDKKRSIQMKVRSRLSPQARSYFLESTFGRERCEIPKHSRLTFTNDRLQLASIAYRTKACAPQTLKSCCLAKNVLGNAHTEHAPNISDITHVL